MVSSEHHLSKIKSFSSKNSLVFSTSFSLFAVSQIKLVLALHVSIKLHHVFEYF